MNNNNVILIDFDGDLDFKNNIRKIVSNYDPAGLIKLGFPDDEYDSEIKGMIREFNSCFDIEKFTKKTYKIFETSGVGVGEIDDSFKDMTKELFNFLDGHCKR